MRKQTVSRKGWLIMATIRYTHGFNLLHQLVIGWGALLGGGIALAATAISIVEPLWDRLASGMPSGIKAPLEWVGGIAIWGGCLYLIFKAIVVPLVPLPTWLYLRLCLFVPATWEDAKLTVFLFEGDGSGKWYPLTALRKVPKEFRRDVLLEFAETILSTRYGFPRSTARPSPSSKNEGSHQAEPRDARRVDPQIQAAYNILGLDSTASAEDIKKAYRTLMRKYHPDVYGNSQPELQRFAHEKAVELNAAYQLLRKSVDGASVYM